MEGAKDKAKELVEKFRLVKYKTKSGVFIHRLPYSAAKQCALIAVDTALEYSVKEDTQFLLSVKQEITNL